MALQSNSAGIFITQLGVSVPTAADYQFVFNSNWPSLQVAFDTTVTLGVNQSLTVAHNLGFVPFTVGTILSSGISIGRIFALSGSFEGIPQSSITLSFDKTNVYLVGDSANSYQVNVKCYNLDITKAVDYTLPQFPKVKQPYDQTVGVKVSKFNKQIQSTDLRDFILHSRAQSPAVLSVQSSTKKVYFGQPFGTFYVLKLIYANPANYVPWTYCFISSDGKKYQGLAPGEQQSGFIFVISTDLSTANAQTNAPAFSGAGTYCSVDDNNAPPNNTNQMSLVVLRDPLIVANTINFQYNGTPG